MPTLSIDIHVCSICGDFIDPNEIAIESKKGAIWAHEGCLRELSSILGVSGVFQYIQENRRDERYQGCIINN
jgi:hypothetical protein